MTTCGECGLFNKDSGGYWGYCVLNDHGEHGYANRFCEYDLELEATHLKKRLAQVEAEARRREVKP